MVGFNIPAWDADVDITAVQEVSMKKVIILLCCLLLPVFLAACGHGWKHNTVPEVKWDEAYADCVYQAESAAGNTRLTKDPSQDWGTYGQIRYLTDKCMEEKGYYQAGEKDY
jgi:hypothetical protein